MEGDILKWKGWFTSKAGNPRHGGALWTGGCAVPSHRRCKRWPCWRTAPDSPFAFVILAQCQKRMRQNPSLPIFPLWHTSERQTCFPDDRAAARTFFIAYPAHSDAVIASLPRSVGM